MVSFFATMHIDLKAAMRKLRMKTSKTSVTQAKH